MKWNQLVVLSVLIINLALCAIPAKTQAAEQICGACGWFMALYFYVRVLTESEEEKS
jgi:hypothetical protein